GEIGGEIGWIERGTAPVFDTAFKIKVGRLSHVIKSPFGFHIYNVLDKRPGKIMNFNSVKDEIHRRILANREQAIYAGWLEQQIQNTRVFKDDSLINQLIVETRGQ
ncbi:MAG: peptidylprolyl isomerase, partial [Bdellovibrionales bacterium]